MRILVVGAGATGGYYGARLAQAGRDVSFLVRPQRAELLRERGLRLITPDGESQIEPQLVTAEALAGPYDLVLVAVKATGLGVALEDLGPAVGSATTVVPLLNGMSHLETLQDRFSHATVLGGVVKIVATLTPEGDVQRFTPLHAMEIGPLDPASQPQLEAAAEVLNVTGYDFSATDDILAAMWAKWVFIATLGAFCCLMRGSVADIVAQPGGAELGRAILAETAAVAAASGHPLARADYERPLATVTAAGAPTTSSMFRDLTAGAPTEVEQIVGDLAEQGRWTGVATPLLDLATLHLRVYEHRRG
jgi:2-dehydropantoate 2-reductase